MTRAISQGQGQRQGQGQGHGLEVAEDSHSLLSRGRPRLPSLPVEGRQGRCSHGPGLGPSEAQGRGFTFLPSSPGSPASPCGQRTHISPNSSSV